MRMQIRNFAMPLLIAGLIAGASPVAAQVTPPTPPAPPASAVTPPRPPRPPRAPRAWSGEDGVARIDTSVSFSPNGTVELSLVAGHMKLSTWNQNKVRVVASTSGPPSLQFDASSSHLNLEQARNGSRGDRNNLGRATYDVTVPVGSRATLAAVSGDIDASGLRGRVEISTVSGAVNVHDVGAGLSVEGVSGNINVGNVAGDVHVENVSGRVAVTGLGGSGSVETVSGGITLNGVTGSSIHVTSVSGDLDFAGPVGASARYNFETHSGRTNLRIAGNANTAIRVETFSGSVSNDYPGAVRRRNTGDDGDTSSVDFIIGQGQGRLRVETFSGSVHISQGNP